MSERSRYLAPPDFLARLRVILPGITPADLDAFEVLVVRNCVIADDGRPHPDLVAWVQAILDRDAGQPAPVPVAPVPRTDPAGMEVIP